MKILTGIVVSTKMNKTIGVEVSRRWAHPIYQKTVKRTKKYMVHDEKNIAAPGDQVRFQECRPISKNKSFTLLNIVGHHTLVDDKVPTESIINPESN